MTRHAVNGPAKVRIFYPADPAGVVPGGIDTFIRGLIKWAPPELEFSLVGMTTDAQARPEGRWTQCRAGNRDYTFFPVVSVADAGTRGRMPLSLRFTAGALKHRARLRGGFDVYDFHRPEPSLLYLDDPRPKNAFFHQDPKVIATTASDNLWRNLPAAYEQLEARAVNQLASAWCVRDSGVITLRQRYPNLGARVRFVPTWVDADVFHPVTDNRRRAQRESIAAEHDLPLDAQWITFVGRLDTQKNPGLLLEAFACAVAPGDHGPGMDAVLLLIGNGVLRPELEARVRALGLQKRVRFLGLQAQDTIARVLQAADLFALSSAYEGMPMALLEALGCGTPAVVTDVGEVKRVVHDGVNGVVVTRHDVPAFAHALVQGLTGARFWRGTALEAVADYQPVNVLEPVYKNYSALALGPATMRHAVRRPASHGLQARTRDTVIGQSVDVLRSNEVVAQLLQWAQAGESRTVCFCNVHSVVTATRSESHRLALRGADMVVPDGAPVAWTLRMKGHRHQDRVDGPDTMWKACAAARERGIKVGLFGSRPEVLDALMKVLRHEFPGLQVTYSHSPPFREATPEEDERIVADITRAGVGLLFVGLGCPKQERWLGHHRGRIPAVMMGLGAAFDFNAGTISRAPHWMRRSGLEWLHRLLSDPRRLWWRYVSTNSLFIARSLRDLLRLAADRQKTLL
jgi:exopolysaccharide biosynthesis WecB/TagA/CpsF family protein